MSHRRAKRLRKMMLLFGFHPKQFRQEYQQGKVQAKRTEFSTLKEMHRANVHADIPDPKSTGIL